MNHKQKMADFISQNDVKINLDKFVEITSNIYHKYEAEFYDDRHASIEKSNKQWNKIILTLEKNFDKAKNLNVLDFGSGTGFATQQLISSNLFNKVEKFHCYDLSNDMINISKSKFKSISNINYYSGLESFQQLKNSNTKFDVIMSNSLIHHLLEPNFLFDFVNQFLNKKGVLVIGHEPNKSFYNSKLLNSVSTLFRLQKRIKNKLFKSSFVKTPNIIELTHKDLVKLNIVKENFPVAIIPKFVDIHVPMSNYKIQPWGELGFDKHYFKKYLSNNIKLINQITYGHIKDQAVYDYKIWSAINNMLSKIYPNSGADAIFIFSKEG